MSGMEAIQPGGQKSPFDDFGMHGYVNRQEYEGQIARIQGFVDRVLSKFGDDVTATPTINTDNVSLMYVCLKGNPQLSAQDRAQIETNYELYEEAAYAPDGAAKIPVPFKLDIRVLLKIEKYKLGLEESMVKKASIIMSGNSGVTFIEKNNGTKEFQVTISSDKADMQSLEDALKQVAEMNLPSTAIDAPERKQLE